MYLQKIKELEKNNKYKYKLQGVYLIADIDKMVNEAQTHAEEDKSKKEAVETRNQADSMVYSTEKSLAEHGDKLDAKDKENIEKSIEDLKDTLKNENADAAEIKTKLDALNTAAMKLGEIMYKQNPQAAIKQNAEQEMLLIEKDSEEKMQMMKML